MRTTTDRLVWIVLASIAWPGIAGAVEPVSELGNSTVDLAQSALGVQSSSDKSTASLKVGGTRALNPTEWADEHKRVTAATLAASIQTPFNSDKDNVKDLGSVSGLTAGTSFKIQAGFLSFEHTPPTIVTDLEAVCVEQIPKLVPNYTWHTGGVWQPTELNEPKDKIKDQPPSCAIALQSLAALQHLVDARNELNKDRKDLPAGLLPAAIKPDVTEKTLATPADRLQNLQIGATRNAYGLSVALKGNRQKFSFASAQMPGTIMDATKDGYGIDVAYTYVWVSSVLNAGFSWERSYTAGKQVQICNPIGTTGSFSCTDGSLKGPHEDEAQIVFGEFRGYLYEKANIAVSPRVEINLKNGHKGVRFPIFFAPDPNHVMDGGLALGWSTDLHFSASVFVSKSFKYF